MIWGLELARINIVRLRVEVDQRDSTSISNAPSPCRNRSIVPQLSNISCLKAHIIDTLGLLYSPMEDATMLLRAVL